MPAEDRVRRDDRGYVGENPPADELSLDREAPPLAVRQPDPLPATGFFEDLVLGAQVIDDLLLPAVNPAGENNDEKVPRLENLGGIF